MSITRIYQSPTGDTWDLLRKSESEAYVRHTPNASSGGNVSQIALDDFLRLQPHSPEHQALVAVIGSTSAAAPRPTPAKTVGEVKGYIHDPKEVGGPYIAVVLRAGEEPLVTLHHTYAEAEKELTNELALQKQTTLSHRPRDP